MSRLDHIRPEFAKNAPDVLEDGVLFVSMEYGSAIHKCCCGCGTEIVTPLTPTDWCVTYDGETITLDPSVGSSTLACGSHYWIERNRVIWVPKWSIWRTRYGRAMNRRAKTDYYDASQRSDQEDNPLD